MLIWIQTAFIDYDNLHNWCDDPDVQARAKHGRSKTGKFLKGMVNCKKADLVADLFLQPQHGFTPKSEFCAIEGYMPLAIQRRVAAKLEEQDHFVWFAMREKQLRTLLKRGDWK